MAIRVTAIIVAALTLASAACNGTAGSGDDNNPDARVPGDSATDPGIAACPWIAEHNYQHPSDAVYEPNQVVEIDVEMDPKDYAAILANPDAEEYRPAAVTFCGQRVEGAGLRFKHSSLPGSTLPKGNKKNPMVIHFGEYVDGPKLRGLRHLQFEYFSDVRMLTERLNWEMLHAAKIPGPRANSAELRINGENIGVFTSIERVDKSYLSLRFGNNDGNLYKHQYCGTFRFVGSDPAAYTKNPLCYEKKTNEAAMDYSDLIRVMDVLKNSSDSQLPARLSAVLDVDAWIPLMAALQSLANADSPNANGNNFFSYHSPTTGKFHIIPWDLDSGFFSINAPCQRPGDLIHWPLFQIAKCHTVLPLFQRVVGIPRWRTAYLDAVRAFIKGPFAASAYAARVDELAALVAPALARDPHRSGSDQALATALKDLKSRQAARVEFVAGELGN